MKQNITKARLGFSLLELLIIVGVIAILSAVLLIRIGDSFVAGVSVKNIAYNLAADLRFAKERASIYKVDHLIRFSPVSPPYTSYQIIESFGPPTGEVQVDEERPIQNGITCQGINEILFTSSQEASSSTTFTLTKGGVEYSVDVYKETAGIGVSKN